MKKSKLFGLAISLISFFALTGCNGEPIVGSQGSQGETGERGEDGLSAYEIYIIYHPEYEGTEEEWLQDLINGDLREEYKVTFETNGGSEIQPQYVKYGELVTRPKDDPIKVGYIFDGWYLNSELFSFDSYKVYDDLTLQAQWKLGNINLTLDANGGDVDYNTIAVTYGENYTLPTPKRDNYTFAGWYIDETLCPMSGIWTYSESDITLKAIWSDRQFEIHEDLNGKYASIVGFDKSTSEVIIPENINVDGEDIPVKAIGEKAFQDNFTITSVTLPNGITSIGAYAFAGCYSLESINIPNNVTLIGKYAFFNCSSLKSLYIPNSVTTIEKYAFFNCSSLASINIPSSVVTIENGVFERCYYLTIYCEASSMPSGWDSDWDNSIPKVFWSCLNYGNMDGFHYAILSEESIKIIDYTGQNTGVIIPESINVGGKDIPVKEIGVDAFSNNYSIISITIPSSVTAIGDSAFSGCSLLTSIYISSSVASIGNRAFSGCSNLTTVTISENSQLTTIGNHAFYNCTSLTSIYIPGSVITIGGSTFSGCSNLTTVTISENSQLTTIDSYAFDECSSLTSIYIPNSVITIDSNAFDGCYNLTIYCEASLKPSGWDSRWNSSNQPVVWNCIDYGITAEGIHYGVLIDEDGNKYISITGYNASNTDVVIPEYINVNGEDIIVKEINDETFHYNDTITSVTIPNSVTTIGNSAFSDCSSLTSIYIPDSVTTIGECAFYYCSNLTTVTFGENSQLTTIGDYAFYFCSSLNSIYIPDSVTKIGCRAFESRSILRIYCAASSEPSGWESDWNYSNHTVVWNCTYDEYLEAIA